jgi:hypothetical protein
MSNLTYCRDIAMTVDLRSLNVKAGDLCMIQGCSKKRKLTTSWTENWACERQLLVQVMAKIPFQCPTFDMVVIEGSVRFAIRIGGGSGKKSMY